MTKTIPFPSCMPVCKIGFYFYIRLITWNLFFNILKTQIGNRSKITYVVEFKPEKEIRLHIWSPTLRHDRIRDRHTLWHKPWAGWESYWGENRSRKGREISEEGYFGYFAGPWHAWQLLTGPPAMPVSCVQGLDFPRSVTSRFGNRRWRMRAHGFSGQVGLPTDARYLVPHLCHSPSM